jgi:hypothetical protein
VKLASELTPSQIDEIKKQLREGKKPSEISRAERDENGKITHFYSNDVVREVRSQMRKEA